MKDARYRCMVYGLTLFPALCACGRPSFQGVYEGTVNETCGIEHWANIVYGPNGHDTAKITRCTGGSSTDHVVVTVKPFTGKLGETAAVDFKGCTIPFTVDRMNADTSLGPTCTLHTSMYQGPAVVQGHMTLSEDGKNLTMRLTWRPSGTKEPNPVERFEGTEEFDVTATRR
jgi:hypothetical protein